MTRLIRYFAVVLISTLALQSRAQDDLLDLLSQGDDSIVNYTVATFKNTRIVSGHSIEVNGPGVLQFMIGHRFGRLNTGWRNLYGIDNATMRLGFEYGLLDNVNIGIGRSSFQKDFDGTIKWKFAQQKYGGKTFPMTMTWVSTAYISSIEWTNPNRINYFSSRMAYYHGLLFARKFEKFSLQISPTVVHKNIVPGKNDHNSIYAIGTGVSIPLNGSVRLNGEYNYTLPEQYFSLINGENIQNSLSIGFDIETGGHVFQLHLTNSRGMTEKFLIGETSGKWTKGDIHFGFNVSRVFTVKHK